MRFWPLQRSLAVLRCPRAPSRGRSRFGPAHALRRRWPMRFSATIALLPSISSSRFRSSPKAGDWPAIAASHGSFATRFRRCSGWCSGPAQSSGTAWPGCRRFTRRRSWGFQCPSQLCSDPPVPGRRPVQPTCRLVVGPLEPFLLKDSPANSMLECRRIRGTMRGYWAFQQASRTHPTHRMSHCCLGLFSSSRFPGHWPTADARMRIVRTRIRRQPLARHPGAGQESVVKSPSAADVGLSAHELGPLAGPLFSVLRGSRLADPQKPSRRFGPAPCLRFRTRVKVISTG